MNDSRDYLITILREKYDYEFARKKTLDDALTLPVTLLSFIVASIYFLVIEIPSSKLTYMQILVKWSLFGMILICAVFAFVFLYRVYFGFRRFYCAFPASKDVLASYSTLVNRHIDVHNDKLKEAYIISDLKDYQIHWYKDCNEANTMANDRRADAFFNARMWLGFSMIICILLLIFICIIKPTMSNKPATPPPPPPPVRREKSDNIIPRPQTQTK